MDIVNLSKYEDFCTWLNLVGETASSSFYSGEAVVHKTYVHIFGTRNFATGKIEVLLWYNSGITRKKILLKDCYSAFEDIINFGNDEVNIKGK